MPLVKDQDVETKTYLNQTGVSPLPTYVVYDEDDNVFASGNTAEIGTTEFILVRGNPMHLVSGR